MLKKKCKNCKILKSYSSFYERKDRPNSENVCKKCRNKRSLLLYKKNIISRKKRSREYYCENREERKKHDLEYYYKNKKERLLYSYKYRKTEKGRLVSLTNSRKYYKSNPIKKLCQRMVFSSVKKGLIKKPEKCSSCNLNKRLHAHHCDYSKPLDVIWLCCVCHCDWHRINGKGLNGN